MSQCDTSCCIYIIPGLNFLWMNIFSLLNHWLNTWCRDGSRHDGAQWGGIAVAPLSHGTSDSVNPIWIVSVTHCAKKLSSTRAEGHLRKKTCNSCSFILHNILQCHSNARISPRMLLFVNYQLEIPSFRHWEPWFLVLENNCIIPQANASSLLVP